MTGSPEVKRVSTDDTETIRQVVFVNSLLFLAKNFETIEAVFKKMDLVADGVLDHSDLTESDEAYNHSMSMIASLIRLYPSEFKKELLKTFPEHPRHVSKCFEILCHFDGGLEIAEFCTDKLDDLSDEDKFKTVMNLTRTQGKGQPSEAPDSEQ